MATRNSIKTPAKKAPTPAAKKAATKPNTKAADPRDTGISPIDRKLSAAAETENATRAAAQEQAATKANDDAAKGPAADGSAQVGEPEKVIKTRPTTAAKMTGVLVEPLQGQVNITDDQGTMHSYPAGTTRMPKAHAEHWYAKANGVTLID